MTFDEDFGEGVGEGWDDHRLKKFEEDQTTKALALLKYALEKEEVDPDDYSIARRDESAEEKGYLGTICLQEQDNGEWCVFTMERGARSKAQAVFTHHHDAVNFFYMRLVGLKKIWVYREEFEKETGII